MGMMRALCYFPHYGFCIQNLYCAMCISMLVECSTWICFADCLVVFIYPVTRSDVSSQHSDHDISKAPWSLYGNIVVSMNIVLIFYFVKVLII